MTTAANLVAFGHPEVERATALAEALLDQAAVVTAEVGSSTRAATLDVALQALIRAAEKREFSLAETLAGLSGALGWVICGAEADLETRAAILQSTFQTAWESSRNGDAAEAAARSEPKGSA